MAQEPPLDQAFIVSVWVEAILYGFLLALFLVCLYINITLRRHQDIHSKIMFATSILLFIIATVHVSISCFRLVQGYIIHAADQGGAVAFFSRLSTWHHLTSDTLMVTQELIGDAIAIYRTYIIWSCSWTVIAFPSVLLVGLAVSGYFVCGLYTTEQMGTGTVFDPKLHNWITAFFVVSLVQSLLTTGLMAYRIWETDRQSAKFRAVKSKIMPIARILIESAALQLLVEIIVLGLYASGSSAQYILLAMITPIVAITFNAITIRIAWRGSEARASISRSSGPDGHHTIGSIRMRAITISIQQDVEAHGDSRSDFADPK